MHCILLECIWIHFNKFIYLVNKHLLRIYYVLYPEHIIKTNYVGRLSIDEVLKLSGGSESFLRSYQQNFQNQNLSW